MSDELTAILDELLSGPGAADDETNALGAVAELLAPFRPSLVLLADRPGYVLACEPARAAAELPAPWLASLLNAERGEGVWTLPPPPEQPSQTPFAVALEDGRGAVLAGLVETAPDAAARLADLRPALRACGRLAEIAILAERRAGRLQTRVDQLRAEAETVKASHAEVMSRVVEEHEHRLQERADRLALEKVCRAAEAASQAKSEFLANMSHELRTPLHGILSFASFGLKKAQCASREDLLQYFLKIDRSGKTLLTLINDLLDLAKLESGRMKYEFGPIDLRLLVATVADEFSSLAAHKNIQLASSAPPDAGTVVGDQAKLMQVVRNLLSNALKFSPEGSTIEIEIEPLGETVQLRVSDRGVGVPDEELEAIFDKFIQSSKTRTGAGGTGLGLAICREIIAAHQGRIWAANRPAGGSVFTFEIPRDPRREGGVVDVASADPDRR